MRYDISKHSRQANAARNEKLTPEKKAEIARKAANTRWEEHRRRKNHKCDPICRCVCGVYMNVHSQFSECKEPKCDETQ